MKIFEGKAGIKVRVLADSVNAIGGNRLTTFEIEYPRMIHSELMTHRALSRNAASSRAIPFAKMMEQLTAEPVRFGANVPGMQDGGEYDAAILLPLEGADETGYSAKNIWEWAKECATMASKAFAAAGYHKQVFNRLTEPFQMIKVVVTATEWDNFFWLRNDKAADPTLHELARVMFEARQDSVPALLEPGQWHLPYVDWIQEHDFDEEYNPVCGDIIYYVGNLHDETFKVLDIEDAIKVSCARCAAVSFRNIDYGVEKSREVYDRLVGDERKHASAFEHCATPMKAGKITVAYSVNWPSLPETWENGISHMDRNSNLWSGNLKGFIQYRKTIPGENYVVE